jgi:Pro-kumamolisin, activation domain
MYGVRNSLVDCLRTIKRRWIREHNTCHTDMHRTLCDEQWRRRKPYYMPGITDTLQWILPSWPLPNPGYIKGSGLSRSMALKKQLVVDNVPVHFPIYINHVQSLRLYGVFPRVVRQRCSAELSKGLYESTVAMKLPFTAILGLVASATTAPSGSSYVVHERRQETNMWSASSVKLRRNALILMSISLTQRNLDHGYGFLMDVSHPSSPSIANTGP